MTKKLCSNCQKIVDIDNHNCTKKQRKKTKIVGYQKKESKSTKELRTKKWSQFRKKILIRDNAICQRCYLKLNLFTYDQLEIHHIKPRETYPELMYDDSNVVTLCKQCNDHLGLNGIDFEFNPDISPQPTI